MPADITTPLSLSRVHDVVLTQAHARRLREVWRSSGWPCKDPLELDLLAAELIEPQQSPEGRETLRLTKEGLAWLASFRQHTRARLDAHERLVAWVAANAVQAGRVSWRGLSLRAWVGQESDAGKWVMAMPDVYSIRNTTVEDYVEPVVHEIKVRRADLLADVRNQAKRAAYLSLASQVWYVLGPDVGHAEDVPPDCGVMQWQPSTTHGVGGLDVVRPAPAKAMRLPFSVWMALAKARPVGGADFEDSPEQAMF